MVQTNHLGRSTGAGDARQVTGGPTLAALPLLIWEHLKVHSLRLLHALGRQIHSNESCRRDKHGAELNLHYGDL